MGDSQQRMTEVLEGKVGEEQGGFSRVKVGWTRYFAIKRVGRGRVLRER